MNKQPKKRIYKIFYSFLALLGVISGVFLFLNQIIFVGLFLIIIPPIIVYFFVFYKNFGKWMRYLILPSLSFFIIIFTIFAIVIESIFMAFNPVNATWRYTGIVEDFGQDEYIHHFPRKIDKNAKNVRFSFAPQFLQGGGHIIFKEELTNDNFQEKYTYFKETQNKNVLFPDFGSESFPMIHVIGEDIKSYEVIVLQGKPYKENDWNHGKISGVALKKENNSIIFWYEFW